jgi:hypothetical protein
MKATLIIPGEKITAEDVEVQLVRPVMPPHGSGKPSGRLKVPCSLGEVFNRDLVAVLDVEGVGSFEVELGARGEDGGQAEGSFEVLKAPDGWSPP